MYGDIIADAIARQGVSLIIAIASLMALVHSRNTHLSERARNGIEEWLYKVDSSWLDEKDKEVHRDSLKEQVEEFAKRYRAMSIAFLCLTATLIFMMLSIVLCASTDNSIKSVGLTVAVFGIVLLVVAIFLSANEFWNGYKTLYEHKTIMRTRRAKVTGEFRS